MKLVFIGTGSAFTVGGNYNSNMYFEADNGKRLLLDCGCDVRHALHELGLDQNAFEAVYISHLHADHVGGMEWLAFKTMFDPNSSHRVDLYCADTMVKPLWNILSGGLCSLEHVEANLTSYFNVKSIVPNGHFNWQGVKFNLFQTVHQISNSHIVPSFGLEALIDGLHVVVSTDTKFPRNNDEALLKLYDTADIIFHDCETCSFKSNVHAHFSELATLDPSIKRKMWLYHYQPGELPDARKEGFRGFVKKGQCFDFKNPKTLI